MAMQAIQEVKAEEAEARKRIEEAKKEASELLKNGEAEAKKEQNRIMEETKAEVLSLEQKAKERGEEEALPVKNEGEKQIKAISEISDAKKQSAVDFLKERILKDGNS